MEQILNPEIIEIAEPLSNSELTAPKNEKDVEISYSCGRCPPVIG